MTRWRRGRRAPQEVLERRYRRLLAWYPADYRAANEDEMLGVALAGAAPGQRRPGPGEAASLITTGARMRFGVLLADSRGAAWGDAAAVFGILGAVLLAAIYAESQVVQLVSSPPPGLRSGGGWHADAALAVGWSLVAVALVLRWRWAAAAGALLGAGAEAARLAVHYANDPADLVASWWQLTLAVVTAIAAAILLTAAQDDRRPLPRRGIVFVAAMAALLTVVPPIQSAFITVTSFGDGVTMGSAGPAFSATMMLREGLLVGLAVTLLAIVVRLYPAARRRVVVLSVPVAAVATLTAWGMRNSVGLSAPSGRAVLPAASQWAVLVAVPVLGFTAGIAWLGWRERMLRLAAAGSPGAGSPGAGSPGAGSPDAGPPGR
jgi:hypothetical protein